MAVAGSSKLSGFRTLAVTSQALPKSVNVVQSVEICAFQFLVAAFLAAISAVKVAAVKPTVENWYCQAISAVL